jgi:pSer/pThr/pTyr-binding forkhead associated (FHA) protein
MAGRGVAYARQPEQTLQDSPPMRAILVALNGGPDIPLGPEPTVVGRHPDCEVQLPSIRISRRHCCMTEVDGKVAVRDLGSTNGTLINGRRVET